MHCMHRNDQAVTTAATSPKQKMASHKVPSFTSPFTQQSVPKTPKSPPLAFQKTSNDALAPFISSSVQLDPLASPPTANMGLHQGDAGALQRVVEKQASAIKALHVAFDAEREAWIAERDSLYQRIGSLEKLLMAGNSHRYVPAEWRTADVHSNRRGTARPSHPPSHPRTAATTASHHPTLAHRARRSGYPV